MGGTKSTNEADLIVNTATHEINQVISNNSTVLRQSQALVVSGINGSTINFDNIDFSQYADIHTAGLQKDLSNQSVRNMITDQVTQTAKTVAQSLNLDPGSADANNLVNTSVRFADLMMNSYAQTCSAQLTSTQVLDVHDINNSTLTFKYIKYDDALKSGLNCVLNDTTVQSARNDLQQQVDQHASTERKGLLDFLGQILIIALVLLFLGVVIFLAMNKKGGGPGGTGEGGGIRSLFDPMIIAMIIGGIILIITGVIMLGYFFHWWPYTKVGQSASDVEKSDAAKRNRSIFIGTLVAFIISLIAVIGLYFWHHHNMTLKQHELVPTPQKEEHHYYENSYHHNDDQGRLAPGKATGWNSYEKTPGVYNDIHPHTSPQGPPPTKPPSYAAVRRSAAALVRA